MHKEACYARNDNVVRAKIACDNRGRYAHNETIYASDQKIEVCVCKSNLYLHFLVLTHQYDNSPESNAQQIQFGRRIEDTIR